MKRQLKRAFLLTAILTASVNNSYASIDRVVEVEQLPALAQQILKTHFENKKVAIAKMEYEWLSKSYDIVFTDGTKVEFDNRGNWTSIDCHRNPVPAQLVPAKIAAKVHDLDTQLFITEIERDKQGYDVELSNGVELKFNRREQLQKIDK